MTAKRKNCFRPRFEALENRCLLSTNGFLMAAGIPGPSTVPGHKGEIEISSFTWEENRESASPTGPLGVHDFRFVMPASTASVPLFADVVSGKHLDKAVLSLVKPGKDGLVEYQRFE